MELKVLNFNEISGNEMYEIARSRFEVFVGEQKIVDEPELDGLDSQCKHIFYEDNGKVIAYCRIVPKGCAYDYISIGRVLVLKEYRKKGLAKDILQQALKYIKETEKEDTVVLSAQVYVKSLYESVGFKEISDVYDEAGIPHVKMKITI